MLYKTVTPREKGMGNIFIGKATLGMFITAIVYTVVILIVIAKFMFFSTTINIIKLLLSILAVMILILLTNLSFASYSTVTMNVVEEPVCTIELGELIFLLFSYIVILL